VPGFSGDGVLLVGHGTRSSAGRAELLELGALVAAAGSVPVQTGFLELSDPPAGAALDGLVEAGCRRIAVVPLMLNAAGHAKSDVPAVVLEGRGRHPAVSLSYARPLGATHATVGLGLRRIVEAGGARQPLLLVARGTSEPEANADGARVARLLAEAAGAPFAVTGYSGLTWPLVPDALEQCRRLGAETIAVVAWYLCTGVLVERIISDAAAFAAASGIAVVYAGHLGPDPSLVPLVWERASEAVAGDVRMSCDVCSYRAPFPGHEERAGQPVGVGHSHLAVEHRHSHVHPAEPVTEVTLR
jgi:sirohydrochlorin cobaltochelatase